MAPFFYLITPYFVCMGFLTNSVTRVDPVLGEQYYILGQTSYMQLLLW